MSAPKYSQENRFIAIASPLGDDVLLLKGLRLTEELGRPFVAHLELRSETTGIAFEEIIAQNVTIRINPTKTEGDNAGEVRYLNGFIAEFEQYDVPGEGSINKYRAVMVPWLWFLTRTADCRIFQNLSVVDIIKAVFDDFGFSDYEFNTTATYEAREYVVQYRETAFNFVSRLMEEVGMYYYFKHEDGKHTLVIVDSASKHTPAPKTEHIPYSPNTGTSQGFERFWEWSPKQIFVPGKASLTDFEFKTPKTSLLKTATTIVPFSNIDKFGWFDYPGGYMVASDGEAVAKIRMEEFEAQYETFKAKGDVRAVYAGAKFTLTDYNEPGESGEYVCVAASFSAQGDEFDMGGEGDDETAFELSLTAIRADTQFRSPRITPRPRIAGPQTAIVVGKSGEEIETDEYGRVKVHFHWHRYDTSDENSSCWIRVAHPWAGKNWGFIFLPRVGQEVIIEFLEGDPDRPIITGSVYNDDCKVPYPLPDNKTISTMKSSSSKGGEGFNEIRFDDTKDAEELFIHAQKDMHVRVLNDAFVTVENNLHTMVKNDSLTLIENNRHTEVSNDSKEKVGNDLNLTVGGKVATEVAGSNSLTVKGDMIEVFNADHSETTSGQLSIKADTIVLEAGTNITLVVGGSSIAIDSSSIDIKTSKFTVTADGNITMSAGGNMSLDASGNGALTASGNLDCAAGGNGTFAGAKATLNGDSAAAVSAPSVTIG